jgi:UPF0271 protein
MRMDLNCDMGESFGAYTLGMDREVLPFITSANVACGWHAGDPEVMERTVRSAAERGVGIGAHPGYPDLLGFGRRNLDCTPDDVRRYVIYQVGALQGFCRAHGVPLQHVKAHGALYLTAVEREDIARAAAEGVASVDPGLIFVALAGAKGEVMRHVGQQVGLRVAYEAFPDRAYTPEGTLQSRRIAGAVISDSAEVGRRALRMAAEGRVTAVDGSELTLEVQTLCVHGDTPSAVDLVRTIRATLEQAGVRVAAMGAAA